MGEIIINLDYVLNGDREDTNSNYIYEMSTLSEWDGIKITMRWEPGVQHDEAHFHAWYSGKRMSMNLSGEIKSGELPTTQLNQIREWLSKHRLEMRRAWIALSNGVEPKSIKPLK